MALKIFHLFSFIFLLFLLLSKTGHAKRDKSLSNDKNNVSSPFEFINHLKGCHKGNKTKEIHKLKKYLHEFGYLDFNQTGASDDDEFDSALESAVKIYQRNYHIKSTGILDVDTVSKMVTPRCGVPDIVKGHNSMRGDYRNRHDSRSRSRSIHTVSHFSFFPNRPRWPPSKTHLRYRFSPTMPRNAIGPVTRAFEKWASATHFTFSSVQNSQNSDLVIAFHRGNHGDGFPFDGPGGTLAHAFAPTNGRFHYDADERWSVGPVQGAYDLETVALHEIGHLLGLGHSSVEQAIMYSMIRHGVTKNLHQDDVQGIRALYGV